MVTVHVESIVHLPMNGARGVGSIKKKKKRGKHKTLKHFQLSKRS